QMADLYHQINENDKEIELLEKQIETTKDKEKLKKLYDALIPAYIDGGKSDTEIKALIEQAKSSIGEYTNSYYQYYASYAPILDEYRKAEASRFSYDATRSLPDVNRELSSSSLKKKLYYMLEDISGDSFPELVIAMNNSENTFDQPGNIRIYDVYRLKDGMPERIFDINSMGYRSVYTICENGFIRCRGSGGADASNDRFYKLEGNTETIIQDIEYCVIDHVPSYFQTDANHNRSQISKEDATEIINSYNLKTGIRWIAL
ncbi:hypothetical protein, partial [Acetobacterium sp.]|uniref:hypothetical protein n=1 Tax=Acetobacterium sp. TaxID=1872094 RepID=UPI003593B132